MKMVPNGETSPPAKRYSLSSLIPTQYVLIGSVVLIGLLNMYKGLFRFSFGFLAGAGIGTVLGFVLADSSVGRYVSRTRSKPQSS